MYGYEIFLFKMPKALARAPCFLDMEIQWFGRYN